MSGLLLGQECRSSFARHETFHARFGWLKKAFDAASRNPEVFTREDATVQLGVGKNMVHAIRYWGLAFKVLEEQRNPDRPRVPHIVPSEFGRLVFDDKNGLDPWLEDPSTLWLLHWRLLRAECLAPTWWVAFNLLQSDRFTEGALEELIVELSEAAGWPGVVSASVRRDVDCMIRTYAVRRRGRQPLDDVLDCPFREMGLLQAVPHQPGVWSFVSGLKATLSASIVLYAALEYMKEVSQGESTISIARLVNDPGSPGRVFRLNDKDLYELLRMASTGHPALHLVEPAGLRQLVVDGSPGEVAQQVLNSHYFEQGVSAGVGA